MLSSSIEFLLNNELITINEANTNTTKSYTVEILEEVVYWDKECCLIMRRYLTSVFLSTAFHTGFENYNLLIKMSTLRHIKYAQRFELVGEFCCLLSSIFFMYDAFLGELEPYYFSGSVLYCMGSTSMLVQSILTISIPESQL